MSSATLRIGRWATRYRLPAAQNAAQQRRRLDGVRAEMIDGALAAAVDGALSAAGIAAEETVCVRRIAATVDLRLRLGDAGLAAAWSAAIVSALRAAVQGAVPGPGAQPVDLVRWRTLADAWLDCAEGVARGDLSRAWAWQQLGIWPAAGAGTAPASLLVQAWLNAPQRIVPLLGALAGRGSLAPLAGQIALRAWPLLAAAAAQAHGLDGQRVERAWAANAWLDGSAAAADGRTGGGAGGGQREGEGEGEGNGDGADEGRAAPRGAAAGAAPSPASPVFAALAASQPSDVPLHQALAVLAALTADPALPRLAGPALRRVLHAERAALQAGVPAARHAAVRAARQALQPASASAVAERTAAAQPGLQTLPSDHPAAAPRGISHTHWGGLLLLLNLVQAAGLLQPQAALDTRPLAWLLYRVARHLLPLAADDPAALAFCGLPPDATPPEGAATPAQQAAIADAADALLAALQRALGEAGTPPGDLLHSVARRSAEVVASPGWIELQFPLSSTDTALRRSGLDLDPGWLPWLGVVLRFRYV